MAHSTTRLDSPKKRYSFTLTPGNMDRYRAMLQRHHQPVAMMSVIIDECIAGLCTTVESLERSLAEGKQLTISEFLKAAGESMDNVKL